MTTEEGNKIIDIFMHPNYTIIGDWVYWNDEHGSRNHIGAAKYHTSWDWLMPVVEKIEKLNMVGAVVISRDHCWIHNNKEPLTHENEIVHADLCRNNKLDAVWYSVVLFVKWYNENK